jgi:Na+/proline symporter
MNLGTVVFLLALALTFGGAALARIHTRRARQAEGAAHLKLNKWLVGLSAGTTGNSGFVVTGAVGLGYAYGAYWLLLPLGWLLGDLVFWALFPARLNALGRQSGANTLSRLVAHGLKGWVAAALMGLMSVMILLGLGGYTVAQWLAGQKFLAGAFDIGNEASLGLFGLMIIGYSVIGGFRGSVYTDTLQAFIRLGGTVLALGAVVWAAAADPATFHANLAAAGPDFLAIGGGKGLGAALGFALGFAGAAVGFGLGQPQIVSRYLAGRNPAETRGAWWIYIGFVQFTWLAMAAFGMVLRGVMPGIADPETGLSVFFNSHFGPLLTGLIAADVFATIASTSNGILVTMAQTLFYDLAPGLRLNLPFGGWTLLVGAATMAVSLVVAGASVSAIVLGGAGFMSAALATPVMIKVLKLKHSAGSLMVAMAAGLGLVAAWHGLGWSGAVNEGGPAILLGLLANAVFVRFRRA